MKRPSAACDRIARRSTVACPITRMGKRTHSRAVINARPVTGTGPRPVTGTGPRPVTGPYVVTGPYAVTRTYAVTSTYAVTRTHAVTPACGDDLAHSRQEAV
ncbi:hypothetical protein [Nocardia acidivorans]|uniref:hypothetical protein n=1 Tax=Nocardia acidivorans TaxID=404580 RepID=UPI000AA7D589|nr:hypothetical protein [Nocardia acidivorans]